MGSMSLVGCGMESGAQLPAVNLLKKKKKKRKRKKKKALKFQILYRTITLC